MREYIPKYLPAHKYRAALAAYQGYEDMIDEIKKIDKDIIFSSPTYRGAGGVARPTEAKAIKLENLKRELERQTRAVEQALVCFTDDERKLFDLSVNHGVRYCDMIDHGVHMSKRTMERRKQEFIKKIAENLFLV